MVRRFDGTACVKKEKGSVCEKHWDSMCENVCEKRWNSMCEKYIGLEWRRNAPPSTPCKIVDKQAKERGKGNV